MSENIITIQNLILTLQKSLKQANTALEHQYLNNILNYFDEEGRPLTKNFIIETAAGEERELELPIISLLNPKQLRIGSVNIAISAYFLGIDKNNDLLISLEKSSETENCEKINISITLNSKGNIENFQGVDNIKVK